MYHLLHTKRPKLENPRTDVFQVVALFSHSAFHCRFQVLICIFPFVQKQYKVFSIHFKTSLPLTFPSIACWQVQAGGIGMEKFPWAGWREEAKKSGGKRDGQSLCWTLFFRILMMMPWLQSSDIFFRFYWREDASQLCHSVGHERFNTHRGSLCRVQEHITLYNYSKDQIACWTSYLNAVDK